MNRYLFSKTILLIALIASLETFQGSRTTFFMLRSQLVFVSFQLSSALLARLRAPQCGRVRKAQEVAMFTTCSRFWAHFRGL